MQPTPQVIYFRRLWAHNGEPDVIYGSVVARDREKLVRVSHDTAPELYEFLLAEGPPIPVLKRGESPETAPTVRSFTVPAGVARRR